jgi:hypothetical protein
MAWIKNVGPALPKTLWVELLLLCEVPEDHKVAALEHCQGVAMAHNVQFKLWLLAPECSRARAYEKWFKSLPPYIQEWSVPPKILSREDYAAITGHTLDDNGISASALEFGHGWGQNYRPTVYGLLPVAPGP